MAAVLRQVFCCCCGRRAHSPGHGDEANENTPFIRPQSNGDEPSYTSYVVNHEAIRDRLGTIVRAKEGKMVNVSTDLPFNLANRVLHGRLGEIEPSSSSSRSRSAHATLSGGASSSSPLGSHSPQSFSHSQSPPPRPHREPSPSIQTSRSNSSLHPGDASYLPPEADAANGVRGPILSARLVRKPGAGGFEVGGTAGALRQGRAVTRGRPRRLESDFGGVVSNHTEGHGEVDAENGLTIQVEGVEVGDRDVDVSLKTPRASDTQPIPEKAISDYGAIQDVAKITCSWGD
ncbi:hypothetical protein BC835DRAFT_1016829 [Cytidiella melzeri]|nr:hypothetical protein BC835DRAFT_1016829 [Cytidiella melzeri]